MKKEELCNLDPTMLFITRTDEPDTSLSAETEKRPEKTATSKGKQAKAEQVSDAEVGIRGHKILTQRVGFLTDIATKEALSDLARENKKTVNALLNEIVADYIETIRKKKR